MQNIPEVKLGLIAVSRDCFPIALSEQRRKNIVAAYQGTLYECPVTVENELDMQKAVADVKEQGCNALVVFLGNFGPETPETLIAQKFDGPCMYVAAAEGATVGTALDTKNILSHTGHPMTADEVVAYNALLLREAYATMRWFTLP